MHSYPGQGTGHLENLLILLVCLIEQMVQLFSISLGLYLNDKQTNLSF